MYKRFIKCGMSRKTYSLGKGRVLKVPIEGREEAGIIQNRNEIECYANSVNLGLNCFPKIISLSEDGKELVAQQANIISSETELNMFLNTLLRKYNCSNDTTATTLAYFCFGIDQLLRQHLIINGPTKANKDDFIVFCKKIVENQNQIDNGVPSYLTQFFGLRILRAAIALLALDMLANDHGRFNVFGEMIIFCLAHPNSLVYADFWNKDQWGLIDNRYVILDAGFSKKLQGSEHYRSIQRIPLEACQLSYPEQNSQTFNGQKLVEIHDPKGKSIDYKFFTSKNTEYILSAGGMSRRIKKACLNDDGLYDWTDKLVFTDYAHLREIMNVINTNGQKHEPTQIKFKKNEMLVNSINSSGRWTTTYKLSDFSLKPEIGKHMLEFKFDGDQGIISKWHPGHDVSVIEASLQKAEN